MFDHSTVKQNGKISVDVFGLEVVRCSELCFIRSDFFIASSAQLRSMEISDASFPIELLKSILSLNGTHVL